MWAREYAKPKKWNQITNNNLFQEEGMFLYVECFADI